MVQRLQLKQAGIGAEYVLRAYTPAYRTYGLSTLEYRRVHTPAEPGLGGTLLQL